MATFANILFDETFKVVLAEPSNRRLLMKLIEFFLPGKTIQHLFLNDKEQHGLILSDKNCTFDLYCTTDTGERMIVEMQFSSQSSFRDRMLYYSTYPIRSQLMERLKNVEDNPDFDKMDYSLSPVYVISIVNFALEHDSPDALEDGLISRYDLRNARNGELMTDALHFVFLELARFPWNRDEEQQCRTLLEQLVFSLKYGHLLQERPTSFQDELLRLLFDATAFAKMDEVQLQNYNAIMTTKLDIIAQKAYARREGLAEGKAEGLAEGKAEGLAQGLAEGRAEGKAEGRAEAVKTIALNMREMGMEIGLISKATGLSAEEIQAL